MKLDGAFHNAFNFLNFFYFSLVLGTVGGSVGLAITQVIGLVGICQYGMRQTAEVENQMTSVSLKGFTTEWLALVSGFRLPE